ncbi:MAG: hypothetical protein GF398_17310 [Chitinivibrionales bacterium]|nr:hypothetical protein [Chitinivibrionales bacterium]
MKRGVTVMKLTGKHFWLAGILLIFFTEGFAQQDTVSEVDEKTMTLDFKDTDIRDVVRIISTGYDLNIVMDKGVEGSVTLHLSDVPVMQGLKTLTATLGLEVVKEGAVFRIRTKSEKEHSVIRYSRGKLTVDVENVEVREFLKQLSSKTAVSIVSENDVEGRVTGKLYGVALDDGLRAILEGNGFDVVKRKGIFIVSSVATETASKTLGGRRSRRPVSGSSTFHIDYDEGKVTLDVSNGNLEDVIKAIAEHSELEIVTYGNLRAEVNAKLEEVPLTEALALLLGGTKFTFIQRGSIILIGDRNPASHAGQALSTSELVHLHHIKADEVPKIMPKNIKVSNVKVVKEQNALLVSGTSEDIVATRDFLRTIDIPTPQVVIDVLVVEYTESLDKSFGVDLYRNAGRENFLQSPTLSGEDFAAGYNLSDLTIGGKIRELADDFFLELKAKESENIAKILAQPSIVTLNGHKATFNVSTTQYFKIETSAGSETPQVRFQPIKFGVQLNITPWISRSGQITAEISPEVSNSEKPLEGSIYPNIFSRSITTTVRLNDGETLVMGGLVRNNNSKSHNKIPILGDLPLVGPLFRSNSRTRSKTNLVIYVTPHIISKGVAVDLQKILDDFDRAGENIFERPIIKGVERVKSFMKPSFEGHTVTGSEDDKYIKYDTLRHDTLQRMPEGEAIEPAPLEEESFDQAIEEENTELVEEVNEESPAMIQSRPIPMSDEEDAEEDEEENRRRLPFFNRLKKRGQSTEAQTANEE